MMHGVCSYGKKRGLEEVTPGGEVANEIYDDLDELPAAPRVDISEPDLVLLERAARAIGAVRVEVVDGEGYLNLHFADGSVVHAWNPLIFSGDALEMAVKLKLCIDIRDDAVCVTAGGNKHVVSESGRGADLMPATRRAITRATADI